MLQPAIGPEVIKFLPLDAMRISCKCVQLCRTAVKPTKDVINDSQDSKKDLHLEREKQAHKRLLQDLEHS